MIDKLTEKKLLKHNEFLRDAARWLVSSGEDPDDLAQETFIKTLLHPPRDRSALRPWSRQVLRSELSKLRRAERRRRRREREHGARHSVPEPFEVLGVEQLRQDILNAIMSLSEPQRDVVFDRFYNALPPREIARQRGLKVETVKSRLKLALRTLRKALDARYGSRETWGLTIVPLAGFASLREVLRAAARGKIGAGSLSLPIGLAAAALLVVLVVPILVPWGGRDGVLPEGVARGDPQAGGVATDPAAAPVESTAQEALARDEQARDPSELAPAREREGGQAGTSGRARVDILLQSVTIRGEVLDVDSNGVARATLSLSSDESGEVKDVESTLAGSYVFTGVPSGTWRIECHASGFLRQAHPLVVDGSKREIEKTFRLERARETRVRIETPSGESFARVVAQRRAASGERDFRRRPFDWLEPRHFNVVATDRPWDASLPSLAGAVRRFPGGTYKPRVGAAKYCGTLVTEVDSDVRVRLYYRHVPLQDDRLFAEGLPEEMTFVVDPEAEIRPLLSRLSVRVVDAASGRPLPAFVQLRGLGETAGAGSGIPTSAENGAVSFVDRVPGFSIVEVSAVDATRASGGRWSTPRIAFLPPGEVAQPITVSIGPPRRLEVRCVREDGTTVRARLQRCRLREDFPRPTQIGDGRGFLIEEGVHGLIVRESDAPVLVTATALAESHLAAAPAVLVAGGLPEELTFVFEPAARPRFRFAQEEIRCHLAVLLTKDELPAWAQEIEGPTEVTAAVVPGEYTLLLYQRDPAGETREVERRLLKCEAEEVFLEFE